MLPGNVKRRVTGMCECSATHSESKPRSSSATASSAGAIEYSVKKIEAPNCMTVHPARIARDHDRRARCHPEQSRVMARIGGPHLAQSSMFKALLTRLFGGGS